MQIGYVDKKGCLRAGVGNIGERKFDSEWNLLTKDEGVVNKGVVELEMHRKPGRFLLEPVFEKGKGTLYVTDKRLVFLLTPTYYRAFQDCVPFTMPYGMKRMREARELKKRGWKEFVEIAVSEIKEVKAYRGYIGMHLRRNRLPGDKGRVPYSMVLQPKKKAAPLLGDLLQK